MVDVIESDHKMKEGFLHIDVLHWEISLLELNLVEEKGMFREKISLSGVSWYGSILYTIWKKLQISFADCLLNKQNMIMNSKQYKSHMNNAYETIEVSFSKVIGVCLCTHYVPFLLAV